MNIIEDINRLHRLNEAKEYNQMRNLLSQRSEAEVKNMLVVAVSRDSNTFSVVLEAVLMCSSPHKQSSYIIEALKQLGNENIDDSVLKDSKSVIYLHLNTMPPAGLTAVAKHFLEEIRAGINSYMWTDLLPRTIQILVKEYGSHEITTHDFRTILGYEFRTSFVDALIQSHTDWKAAILPAIASMIRNGVPLTDHERYLLVEKLCFAIRSLPPFEVPIFAYHLLRASNTSKLLVGVLFSLNSYFYRYYYMKRMRPLDEMELTQDSIDKLPEKMFCETEQNILVHIYNTTEYDLTERQVASAITEVTYTPSVILSPFMLASLLTITTMNRSCDANKVSKSDLLNIIRLAIFNNFYEEDMLKSSLNIKYHLRNFPAVVDVENILKELVKNSKEGSNEILTAGVIGLSYSLLRYRKHGEQLYYMAAKSLIQFLSQRRLYIKGVIQKLIELMLMDPKATQYKECLEMIVNSRLTITADECKELLKNVFEDMPYMGAGSALDMMSFIFPLMKNPGVSTIEVRTKFINMIRKIVSDRNQDMRKIAAHGATLLLKHIKYDTVTSGVPSQINLTAPYITGFNLISQMTQMRRQAPSPHDMLTLEIMGVLMKCLGQEYDVKEIMYRGLRRAAGFNHKVLPHVIDFLIPHFKNFIELIGSHFQLKLDQLVTEEAGVITVHDNIGVLAELLIFCVVEANVHKLQTENLFLRDLLSAALDKTVNISFQSIGISEPLTERHYIIGVQFIGFLEALMSYAVWKATPDNGFILKMLKIFEHYTKCSHDLKKLCTFKPNSKRKREEWMKNIKKIDSILDIGTLLYFLQIFYDNSYNKLPQDLLMLMNSKSDFKMKILAITAEQISNLRAQPDYVQVKHSKRSFDQLCTCTCMVFSQLKLLVGTDEEFYTDETIALLEILKECTTAATNIFMRKFDAFLQKILATTETEPSKNVFLVITEITEIIKKLYTDLEEPIFVEGSKATKLFSICLTIIRRLLQYIDAGSEYADLLYKYFFELCSNYELNSKTLSPVFKILFVLREKSTQGEDFYTTVALLIAKQYGFINEQEGTTKFELKAIAEHTVDLATILLLELIRHQLEHHAFLLKKSNCLLYRLTKIPGQKQEENEINRQITEIERMTIHSMISVCKVMLPITNAQIPLGKVIDSIFRVLIQLHANGEKLSKMYINHVNAVGEGIDFTRYRDFIKTSKPLTKQMGAFILYVEDLSTQAASHARLNGTKAAKKVLKDTRLLPKYVRYNEKFSCAVINLSVKVKDDFNDLLHLGVYRDFKIRTEELKEAVLKSAQIQTKQTNPNEFQPIEDDESETDEDEELLEFDQEQQTENSE